MFPAISSKIYGSDLIGAAAGSLGVLFLLDILGGINTSLLLGIVVSIGALIFTLRLPRKNIRQVMIPALSFFVVSALLGVSLAGLYSIDVPVGTNPAKDIYHTLNEPDFPGKIIETRWSAFGRTDLVEFRGYPEEMAIYIDGTAESPMYRFSGDFNDQYSRVGSLKAQFPGYFPFLFLHEEEKDNALIIGPGGGRDILLALMGGVGSITAVEVNRDLVDIVREYSWYNGGIYTDLDNVDLVVDEGRNFLKCQKEKYDIIMLSLAITKSSRSIEGYALTENFLFTRNSINDYLEHLTDEGRLVVVAHDELEISRLLSISLDALGELGISNTEAMKQIYILGSDIYPLFVLKKAPFEPWELPVRHKAMYQLGYTPISSYFPYVTNDEGLNPVLMDLNTGNKDSSDLERIAKQKGYDISSVTDNNPFFYKFERGIPQSVSLIFWVSVIILLLVILVPPLYWMKVSHKAKANLRSRKGFNQNSIRFALLFLMLGVGFMMIEISLIQRFILFLGQPVLSIAVLLFSLLVGTGTGSIFSGRLASSKIVQGITIACLSIAATLLIYTFLFPLIFNQLLGTNFAIRLVATFVIMFPLGFLMGFPFPSGIRLLKIMKMENYIPWMWGINGVSSVLGSTMTIAVAISFGFTQALLIGAGCYFIAFLIFQKGKAVVS